MNYNKMIDHTVLKADTPLETVKRICDEAMEYGFASVCINPCHVAYCADYLKDSDVNVCTVIGFPLGANTSAVKAFETKDAIANGADEIDMVMNIGALKDKNYDLVRDDVKAVVEAAGTLIRRLFVRKSGASPLSVTVTFSGMGTALSASSVLYIIWGFTNSAFSLVIWIFSAVNRT